MAIKVSDIHKLKPLRKFRLLAGENGLSNEVTSVCLADFEIDENFRPISNSLDKGSFVLTSMRDHELFKHYSFLDILKALHARGIAGLAYNDSKIILTKKEVEFCNKNGIAIFGFDIQEIYIEDVLYEIMQTLYGSNALVSKEKEIERLIKGGLTRRDVKKLANDIEPDLLRNCTVTYVKGKDPDVGFSPIAVLRANISHHPDDNCVIGLGSYNDGLFILVSMNRMDEKKRDAVVDDILKPYVKLEDVIIVSSREHLTTEELDVAFRECHHTFIAATIEDIPRTTYEDIGVYRFLIPNIHSHEESEFMKKYIRNMTDEQLETAIVFVKNNGNYDLAAKELICHRNTVRYRISKIHEKTDPERSELVFYENLSAAIKIYFISRML